jgi:hypothetical protein
LTAAIIDDPKLGRAAKLSVPTNEVRATRRFRTRHMVRAGRRLPAAHADHV